MAGSSPPVGGTALARAGDAPAPATTRAPTTDHAPARLAHRHREFTEFSFRHGPAPTATCLTTIIITPHAWPWTWTRASANRGAGGSSNSAAIGRIGRRAGRGHADRDDGDVAQRPPRRAAA